MAPILLAISLSLNASAQGAVPAIDPVVPIHTAPADPDGGDYGVWAAGPGFKASFHDGFAFFPTVGPDAEERAWRWRTQQVRVGGARLIAPGEAPAHAASPTRYEYRYGAVTEAYDVRADGVEQTFVIHARPGRPGDLTVSGRVDTALRATVTDSAHRALAFGDPDGETAVDYGQAWTVDAGGRRTAIASAWDGEHLTLTVPAAVVANAAFPLVIDPIIGTRQIASGDDVHSVEIVRDDRANKIWLVQTTRATARDRDLKLIRADDDFSNPVVVFADVTNLWSTEDASVAPVVGASKVVAGFHRQYSNDVRSACWHTHDAYDTTPNSDYGVVPRPVGSHDWRVDVGGSRSFSSGNHALLVFQRDESGTAFSNTSSSIAMYSLIDVSGAGQGTPTAARAIYPAGPTRDQEFPTVTQLAEGGSGSGWVTAWQQYRATTGVTPWSVAMRRIESNGGLSAWRINALGSRSDAHALTPTIAGERGRYLLYYAESPLALVNNKTPFPQGHSLVAERIDWAEGGVPRRVHPPVRVHDAAERRFLPGQIAFDSNSRSHWAVPYTDTIDNVVRIDKLGYRGGVTATTNLSLSGNVDPHPGGAAFDDDVGEFVIGWAKYNSQTRVWVSYGSRFTTAKIGPNVFGVGCTNARISWFGSSQPGDEFAGVRLSGGPPDSLAALVLATHPDTLGLTHLGMRGCFSYLRLGGPGHIAMIGLSTDSTGSIRLPIPLPEDFGRNLFLQFFPLEPGANALGVTATQGLHVTILP